MRSVMAVMIVASGVASAGDEGILPRELTVDLPKKCEILRLHTKPDRNSPTKFTNASYGTVVQNMGCIRNITQKELDEAPPKKRYFLAWENPVWCKVAVGDKKGWVLQQYLKNEEIDESEDEE
jgi:hypothetical protein